MNHSTISEARRAKYVALAVLASGVFLSASVRAQTPGANVYFDPTVSGTATAGGSGDFSTSDFWNGSTDAPLVSGTNVPGDFVPGEGAIFNGPPSTVTVASPVNPDYLEVNVGSGTETFGTALGGESAINLPIGWNLERGQQNAPPDFLNPINIDAGTENVVFNSNVNLGVFNHSYGGADLNSASSGNVSFNGGITFTNDSTDNDNVGQPGLVLQSTADSTFTINSLVNYVEAPGSAPVTNGNVGYVLLNSTGSTLTLTPNASFKDTDVRVLAGTILDQGAAFTSPVYGIYYQIVVGGSGQYLTDTPGMTITSPIVFQSGGGTLGGALAATTTIASVETVGYSGTNMDLTSAAGGRVNFTGDIHNGNNYSIVKVGAGTIALDDTQGRGEDQNAGWEVQNGTMLINGSDSNRINGNNQGTSLTGSGLQIDNVATASLVHNVQTYATLGGTGDTHVAVTAVGANSSITPGDPTVNGGIGTLTLNGGLTASSGLTLNFVLDGEGFVPGVDSSLLEVPTLSLNGVVTVNFTTVDTVLTGTPYTVMYGGNGTTSWTAGDNLSFDISAPAGYALDETYGTGGYMFDTGGSGDDFLSVQFVAAPEPSTWALMGLGVVLVAGAARFRKLA